MHRTRTALLAGLLTLASCGTSAAPEAALDTTTTAPQSTSSSVDNSQPERSPVTTASDSSTSSSSAPATIEPTSTSTSTAPEPAPADDVLRLAPAAEAASPLLQWDRNGISSLGHGGTRGPIAIPNLAEVTAVPLSSPAFQIADNDQVIWEISEEGPVELLMVPESEALTLEGAGLDADGEPVVYYQHHIYADPASTVSSLRTYRRSDGQITEIVTTGGWESGVTFSHISPLGPDNGDVAVALWGAEGWVWLETIDIRLGQIIFNSENAFTGECFDGDLDCVNFRHAVAYEGDVLGIRSVENDTGLVTAFGLWRYDTATGTETLLDSWPWDNGLWYVEDMFIDSGLGLVISLEDGEGNPLPALLYDLDTGESQTEPEAVFLRPAFLS